MTGDISKTTQPTVLYDYLDRTLTSPRMRQALHDGAAVQHASPAKPNRRRRFWRDVVIGWQFGSLVLMPLWVLLLCYCVWEIAHGR